MSDKLNFLKGIVPDEMINSFIELSKDSLLIKTVLNKTNNIHDFISFLMAAIVFSETREIMLKEKLAGFLNNNPIVKTEFEKENKI